MDYLTAWQNGIPLVRPERGETEISASAEISDRHLINSLLAGDEAAFELIFERYKRLVASIAGRFFHQSEEIEEIIQITFTKAFLELARFRGDHNPSLASWLGKIARNACLDVLRTRKRKPENLLCELTEHETVSLLDFAEQNGGHSEKNHIDRDLAEKLLSRLAVEDRIVLQMLHGEEMSVADIAEIMNWSQSKVKLRAWRARNSLRKILNKYL
jgi:RNA polymerase sigma-70 factor (ECF subfamily)